MNNKIRFVAIILSIIMVLQIIVPGVSAAYLNMPIKVGTHKAASKGKSITSSCVDTIENEDLVALETETTGTVHKTPIIGEEISLRDKYSKYYRHKDGSYTAASYSEPIHYRDSEGNWIDIDNSLVVSSQKINNSEYVKYITKSSDNQISFPQDLGNNQKISIGKNGHDLKIGVSGFDENLVPKSSMMVSKSTLTDSKAVVNNDEGNIKNYAIVENEKISDDEKIAQYNNEQMTLKNRQSSIKYKGVFKDTDLEYIITSDKIKENLKKW